MWDKNNLVRFPSSNVILCQIVSCQKFAKKYWLTILRITMHFHELFVSILIHEFYLRYCKMITAKGL